MKKKIIICLCLLMFMMVIGYSALSTSLDLSSFDTAKVTPMESMFNGDNNLKAIYASGKWSTLATTSSVSMFYHCTALVGGNGTKYNANYVDKTYARVDTASTPGYFAYKVYVS